MSKFYLKYDFGPILNRRQKERIFDCNAEVAELVDAHASGACAFGCTGSSPVFGTESK